MGMVEGHVDKFQSFERKQMDSLSLTEQKGYGCWLEISGMIREN